MTSLSEKTCTRCGETKSLRHFYRRTRSPDGLSAACIVCRKAEWKRLVSTPAGRERKRRADADWRANNRDRIKAYYRVQYAVEKGKIKKPARCPNCKARTKVVASFIRIEPPIEFQWLCRQCISDRFWK